MKRTISMLLAIVMVFSLMPMTAFAVETDPTVTFTTTFAEDMVVGDTFSVTATLANNPGFFAILHVLKWNDEVVKFVGFETEYDEDEEADVLKTEVLGNFTTLTGEGIVAGDRTSNSKKNGLLYVANFEIIGSGALELGMVDEYGDEYCFDSVDGGFLNPILDLTALTGLSVAGSDDGGVVIPDDAPFTAITTDAGAAIAIEQQDDVNGVPYYIITIPEDAETAYLTAPDQVIMADWTTGEMQATAYAYEIENGWNQLFISYNYEESDDGPVVEIPMYMVASDWSGEVELCFVEDEDGYLTHAFGIEASNYACLGIISFRYGTVPPEDAYTITVEQPMGGTVSVAQNTAVAGEYVGVTYQANDGYRFKSFLINGAETYLENGFFKMPANDVTVSAVFEATHTCNYINETVDEKYLKSEATCQSAAVYYKSCECGAAGAETFTSGSTVPCSYEHGVCKWCSADEPVLAPGFRFATSADVSAETGDNVVVSVKITGHSDASITTYNAYDLTLTFDSEKLEFVGYDGAVKSDNGQVKVDGNTIRIVGCGAEKGFGIEIAKLTFKTTSVGAATVTIEKVQVSEKNEAIKKNVPEATPKHDENSTAPDMKPDETPAESVIVVPYTVTKPDFVSGNDKILHGETYIFSFTDTTNYNYTDLTVTVDGVEVAPAEENGIYTIENVTGAIVITATQNANTYEVTFDDAVVSGDKTATYGEDYFFTVIPGEGKEIESVSILDDNGNSISYTYDAENNCYIIAGSNISGTFTISVTLKDKESTETTITFVGIVTDEIAGGNLILTGEIGQAFIFTLIKDTNFTYVVKVGEQELVESTEVPGEYTIPAELVAKEGVTVVIEKTPISQLKIEVSEFFNFDGKVMFLILAKDGDKVLSYAGNTMFYSGKYQLEGESKAGAYCWLVVSTDEMNTAELVLKAAEEVITAAAEGVTATAIAYNYDVNGTTKVDVNDAQLAYDMYNASYMDFTDDLPMKKFLEADMETDRKLDTKDVAAIVSYIINYVN